MGTFELINAIASLIGGGILTLWSQRAQDLAEERKFRAGQQERQAQATDAARNHKAQWKGFYWVRGAIALIVVSYFFLVPSLAIFMDGVQVAVGYYDTANGFWPWSGSYEAVTWVKAGAAEPTTTMVFDPVRNNVLISIIAMFFGNQFTRRG